MRSDYLVERPHREVLRLHEEGGQFSKCPSKIQAWEQSHLGSSTVIHTPVVYHPVSRVSARWNRITQPTPVKFLSQKIIIIIKRLVFMPMDFGVAYYTITDSQYLGQQINCKTDYLIWTCFNMVLQKIMGRQKTPRQILQRMSCNVHDAPRETKVMWVRKEKKTSSGSPGCSLPVFHLHYTQLLRNGPLLIFLVYLPISALDHKFSEIGDLQSRCVPSIQRLYCKYMNYDSTQFLIQPYYSPLIQPWAT